MSLSINFRYLPTHYQGLGI